MADSQPRWYTARCSLPTEPSILLSLLQLQTLPNFRAMYIYIGLLRSSRCYIEKLISFVRCRGLEMYQLIR